MIYEHNLSPVIVKLGPLEPRWYALMYILGFVVLYFFIARNPKFRALGKTKDDAMDLLTYGFVGVLAGGRLGYILFYNLKSYLSNPLSIFKIWEGGMSFHGGLIGSILAVMIYAKRKQIPRLTMWDIVALPTPIGLMLGRLGNFINGELWGAHINPANPKAATWGVRFKEPVLNPATNGYELQLGDPRHPTQLYEAGLEGLLLFIVLWFVSRSEKLKPGSTGAVFLMGYGLARFIVEFNRQPDAHIGYLAGTTWMTMGHVLTLPMILGGLGMLIWCNRPAAPQTEVPESSAIGADGEPAAEAPVTESAETAASSSDSDPADTPKA